MPEKKKSQQKGAPPWLVSMGDMNNLLMCFFIVMMGEDVVKTQQEEMALLASAIKGNVGILQGGKTVSKAKLAEMGQNMMALPSPQRDRAFARNVQSVLETLKTEIQARAVRVTEDERGIIISLSSDMFFDPGSARLTNRGRAVVGKVGDIIKGLRNFVRIEGHTDDQQLERRPKGQGYETNWELSSQRSINVLRYLAEEENVNPKQLSSVAFGQTRPVGDNTTPEGRSLNRRVDIVIVRGRGLEETKDKRIQRPMPDEEWR